MSDRNQSQQPIIVSKEKGENMSTRSIHTEKTMSRMTTLSAATTLVAIAMFAMTGVAHGAADLGVNFGEITLSSSDQAGVQPRANWNNANPGGAKTGTVNNLTLSDGTSSSASVTFGGKFVGGANPGGSGASNTMLSGFLEGFGPGDDAAEVTVSGMDDVYGDGAAYDVYVYVIQSRDFRAGLVELSGFDSFSGETTFYTKGLQHFTGNEWKEATTTTDPGSDLSNVEVANFVKFSGVTGDAFTVTGYGVIDDSGGGRLRQGISGVQTIIPEPASLALFGIGGLVILARRKRA